MAGERPILIVDDDRSLREELAAQLQVDGEFLAEEAGSVAEAEARLKSLGDIDGLPTADPDLTRTWLLAHLIAAVLTEDLANQILGFSPCGWPPQPALALAGLEASPRDNPPRHRPPAAHPRPAPLATTAPQPG